jgi:hypothetical protein
MLPASVQMQCDDDGVYILHAVVLHEGTESAGHYTSVAGGDHTPKPGPSGMFDPILWHHAPSLRDDGVDPGTRLGDYSKDQSRCWQANDKILSETFWYAALCANQQNICMAMYVRVDGPVPRPIIHENLLTQFGDGVMLDNAHLHEQHNRACGACGAGPEPDPHPVVDPHRVLDPATIEGGYAEEKDTGRCIGLEETLEMFCASFGNERFEHCDDLRSSDPILKSAAIEALAEEITREKLTHDDLLRRIVACDRGSVLDCGSVRCVKARVPGCCAFSVLCQGKSA